MESAFIINHRVHWGCRSYYRLSWTQGYFPSPPSQTPSSQQEIEALPPYNAWQKMLVNHTISWPGLSPQSPGRTCRDRSDWPYVESSSVVTTESSLLPQCWLTAPGPHPLPDGRFWWIISPLCCWYQNWWRFGSPWVFKGFERWTLSCLCLHQGCLCPAEFPEQGIRLLRKQQSFGWATMECMASYYYNEWGGSLSTSTQSTTRWARKVAWSQRSMYSQTKHVLPLNHVK